MTTSTTREIIDRIFKEPGIKYELTEFETLGMPIHQAKTRVEQLIEDAASGG